jgi:Ca2+-binding RTX toxin-like protein
MRRRAIILATTMAVALVVASSVALATEITCPNSIGNLCIGTDQADTMTGTGQNDDMSGRGGGDTMRARGGKDTLVGNEGKDVLMGGHGADAFNVEPSIGSGIDTSVGGAGNDSLSGGYGDDTYFFSVDWGADRIPAGAEGTGMGTDALDLSSIDKPLDVDLVSSADRDEVFSLFAGAGMLNFPATVQIEDVNGGQARDVIRGNDLINSLTSNAGNDSLYGRGGNDILSGDLGADALSGGIGSDQLNGREGSDVYLFEDGWGDDSVTDAAGPDQLFFGALTSSVTVDLVTGKAYETAFVSFELSPNSVKWTPGVIDNVTGGYGDDTIDVENEVNGDTVNCGPGNDKVYADVIQGDSGNTVLADEVNLETCENVNPTS